jgi:hypothetical protein
MSLAVGRYGRTNLQGVYEKVIRDKQTINNISVMLDPSEPEFASYLDKKVEAHDAGWDAYMTGVVFALLGKYLEIGNLIQSRAPERMDEIRQKRKKAPLEAFEEFTQNQEKKKVRHFTAIQNQKI